MSKVPEAQGGGQKYKFILNIYFKRFLKFVTNLVCNKYIK